MKLFQIADSIDSQKVRSNQVTIHQLEQFSNDSMDKVEG